MLVLTRKKGERVLIGDDIVVTLIDVRGDGVRIGFDAPRGVSIQRAEVVRAVSEANTEAAASSPGTEDLLRGLLAKARKPEPRQQGDRQPPSDARRATPSPQPGPAPTPDPTPPEGRPRPTPPRPRP